MYIAMWKLVGRWHLESSSENTLGDSGEWIMEVVLAEGFVLWDLSHPQLRGALKVPSYLKVPYS